MMTADCPHHVSLWRRGRNDEGVVISVHCAVCGQLGVGVSNDGPAEVQVEIRAAELAHSDEHWARLVTRGVPGEDDEVDGFLMWHDLYEGAPETLAHLAGYLAREINAVTTVDESKLKSGDRVVVRGVPRMAHDWDIGTVRGQAGNGMVWVRWDRAQESYSENPTTLELADASS
jgi:hypothetical protein